jgi:hypothetical protein
MNKRMLALGLTTMSAVCTPVWSANDSAIGKDLKATIVLQGQPCDQIASTKRNADSDYLVSCKDGNRYHIFVNAQGRVIVDKQ